MPTQPTILVKKKDGTSARMTMDEFKDYVRNTKTTKLRNTDDYKSPLEVGEVKEARKQEVVKTKLPEDRGDAFDAVIRNLKFPVRDELRPRLKSLIVSRVKDIRTDEQVVEYATRAVDKGGLGLSEAQAGELVGAFGIKTLKHENIKTSETVASVRTPARHASQGEAGRPNPDNRTPTDTFPVPRSPFLEHRPMMHDVVVPVAPKEETKASVGPVEELQQMTLVDFRRLSSNPAQAGEILLNKFQVLRKDDFVIYLKAVKAWHNSPLYLEYQRVIADALNHSVKIQDSWGSFKKEEWEALVKMCHVI